MATRPPLTGQRRPPERAAGEGERAPAVQATLSSAPWMPAPYELADVSAMQALHQGKATPEQQRRALDWIIMAAAGAYEWSFRPGGQEGDRATTMAEGRRFVGLQIIKMLKLNVGLLRNRDPRADAHEPTT